MCCKQGNLNGLTEDQEYSHSQSHSFLYPLAWHIYIAWVELRPVRSQSKLFTVATMEHAHKQSECTWRKGL